MFNWAVSDALQLSEPFNCVQNERIMLKRIISVK